MENMFCYLSHRTFIFHKKCFVNSKRGVTIIVSGVHGSGNSRLFKRILEAVSGNSSLWISIKMCYFKSFPLMHIKHILVKYVALNFNKALVSGARSDTSASFLAVLISWIYPNTAATCSCLEEWLHGRDVHVSGKERPTNEYSEIPESGAIESKVLNIRDVYVRSDMHDKAIEQKCRKYPRPHYFSDGTQNKCSPPKADVSYIFLLATVLSHFQTQEGNGEWSQLSAELLLTSSKGSLHTY